MGSLSYNLGFLLGFIAGVVATTLFFAFGGFFIA